MKVSDIFKMNIYADISGSCDNVSFKVVYDPLALRYQSIELGNDFTFKAPNFVKEGEFALALAQPVFTNTSLLLGSIMFQALKEGSTQVALESYEQTLNNIPIQGEALPLNIVIEGETIVNKVVYRLEIDAATVTTKSSFFHSFLGRK